MDFLRIRQKGPPKKISAKYDPLPGTKKTAGDECCSGGFLIDMYIVYNTDNDFSIAIQIPINTCIEEGAIGSA
jgi:hypothetical protein